jgi:hypothetical protein
MLGGFVPYWTTISNDEVRVRLRNSAAREAARCGFVTTWEAIDEMVDLYVRWRDDERVSFLITEALE